jgi:cell wall assembly regulator SMI1
MPAAEREAFLEVMLPEQIRAEVAIHNGDVTPRLSTWSQRDP